MNESVKFIFKTLIKVPIMILVCYTVFNVFMFGMSYFKLLGLSYVTMQTAVENNFVPEEERTTLSNYMAGSLETEILQNVDFTSGTEFNKQQYGEPVTVGVSAHYKFLWPLMPKEQHKDNANVDGMNNEGSYKGDKTDAELEDARNKYDSSKNNIEITYTVPGLKYYADQEN